MDTFALGQEEHSDCVLACVCEAASSFSHLNLLCGHWQVAHAQNLTGFNWDLEATGSPSVNRPLLASFLNKFVAALHGANPRIGVSYDGGNDPLPNVVAMDRLFPSNMAPSTSNCSFPIPIVLMAWVEVYRELVAL